MRKDEFWVCVQLRNYIVSYFIGIHPLIESKTFQDAIGPCQWMFARIRSFVPNKKIKQITIKESG
jgi:hypothetical protein